MKPDFLAAFLTLTAVAIFSASCHNPNQVTYTAPPPRTMPLDSVAALSGAGKAVWQEPSDSASFTVTVPGDSACPVQVGLYNSGRSLVRILVDSLYSPGNHTIRWLVRDSEGKALPLGIYYYQFEICGKISTLKFPYRRENC